ncbi:hypothetical protein ACCAA_420033 [Candidatus Accumulibacter aalborgensis]|uniref:Uncharacterized protein n=1 Tax=Candidatus Accumulibacter aalborgensis TaxID=1860102 RepID=A0A1A8XQA0_9PROT|nr:hypothetical protein ACCAA_420033 [Candidatus Accumulibacter aalborgensis]
MEPRKPRLMLEAGWIGRHDSEETHMQTDCISESICGAHDRGQSLIVASPFPEVLAPSGSLGSSGR